MLKPGSIQGLRVFLILLILSFILYGNTLQGEFVGDDYLYTSQVDLRVPGTLLKLWFRPLVPYKPELSAYRPLTVFSFAVTFQTLGESAFWFHLTNVLLNGVNSFLFFLVIRKLFNNQVIAIISALFYSVFPIHTEAVANIRARDEILSSIFTFFAWLLLLSAFKIRAKPHYGKLCLSSVILLLVGLSKDWAVVRTLLILATFWIVCKSRLKEVLTAFLAYLPSIGAYLYFRYQALGRFMFYSEGHPYSTNALVDATFLTRLWTGFKILEVYIQGIVLPIRLSATYHLNHLTLVFQPFASWQTLAGILIMGILVTLVLMGKTRPTPLGIGALTFLGSYITVSQFFFPVADIVGERWMYFPSAGIAMMGGYLAWKLYNTRLKLVAGVVIGLLLVLYSVRTVARNRVWLSDLALFKSMVDDAPQSVHGHYNLAGYYLDRGQVELAKKEALIAYRIDPRNPALLNILSGVAVKEGRADDAEKFLLESLRWDPNYAKTYFLLGGLYYSQGQYEKAMEVFSSIKPLLARPYPREFVLPYAATLSKLGRVAEAKVLLEEDGVSRDN